MARFATISSDLQGLAEAAVRHFSNLGYSTKVEPSDAEFPGTPAFTCKRNQTVIHVEVGQREVLARVNAWIAYCRSRGKDRRVCVVVPIALALKRNEEQSFRESGIGLIRGRLDGSLEEVCGSTDLAINVRLPELKELGARGRKILGPAHEKFVRGEWREGFEEACGAIEELARGSFLNGLRTGRITLVGPAVTRRQAERATMGQLAGYYKAITSPVKLDIVFGKVLDQVLSDRNRVTHKKHKAATEARLRASVEKHIWAIFNAVREATA